MNKCIHCGMHWPFEQTSVTTRHYIYAGSLGLKRAGNAPAATQQPYRSGKENETERVCALYVSVQHNDGSCIWA